MCVSACVCVVCGVFVCCVFDRGRERESVCRRERKSGTERETKWVSENGRDRVRESKFVWYATGEVRKRKRLKNQDSAHL